MTIKERWVAYPRVDFGLALLGAFLTLVEFKEEGSFYSLAGAIAGTSGVLLGMSAVVYGLFQQSQSSRVGMVRVAYRAELARNWKSVLFGFIWTCALGILAMVAFPLPPTFMAPTLLGFGAVLMLVRAARMAWLLSLYLDIDKADSIPTLRVRADIPER